MERTKIIRSPRSHVSGDNSEEIDRPLPPNWERRFSRGEHKPYYLNLTTGRTQWKFPYTFVFDGKHHLTKETRHLDLPKLVESNLISKGVQDSLDAFEPEAALESILRRNQQALETPKPLRQKPRPFAVPIYNPPNIAAAQAAQAARTLEYQRIQANKELTAQQWVDQQRERTVEAWNEWHRSEDKQAMIELNKQLKDSRYREQSRQYADKVKQVNPGWFEHPDLDEFEIKLAKESQAQAKSEAKDLAKAWKKTSKPFNYELLRKFGKKELWD